MRRLPICLLAVACLAGCKSTARVPYSPTEERPRVAAEARWWEEQGDREITRAHETESLRLRELHFAVAVDVFVTARSLYYEELEALENAPSTDVERMRPYPGIKWAAGGPVPAGRREALEIEIARLSDEIYQLVRERPIEEPKMQSLSARLTPR
jgi:hypothetical protein